MPEAQHRFIHRIEEGGNRTLLAQRAAAVHDMRWGRSAAPDLVSLLDQPGHQREKPVFIQNQTPRLPYRRETLLIFMVFDRPLDPLVCPVKVMDVDRDKTFG